MKAIPTLYLFESSAGRIWAVGDDKTGCSVPKLVGDAGWRLRGEIHPDKLPADIVLTAYTKGFCMLDDEDLQTPPE